MRLPGWLRECVAGLGDLFFPRACLLCGSPLVEGEECLCLECADSLPRTLYHRYWTSPGAMNPMEERMAGIVPFVHASAAFFYRRESPLASLVHDFKYRGFSRLAVVLGRMAGREFRDGGVLSGVDLLLPVPLHYLKQARRGYSQTLMLARGISEATGIPVGSELKAVRGHRTQTSLSPEERRTNTRGVFRLEDSGRLAGLHVALVDDICTTGATLTAAAEACLTVHPDMRLTFVTLGVTW